MVDRTAITKPDIEVEWPRWRAQKESL